MLLFSHAHFMEDGIMRGYPDGVETADHDKGFAHIQSLQLPGEEVGH